MDVYSVENGVRTRQELTEKFSSTWSLTYNWKKHGITFDYNGNLYSPMDLPTLGPTDPRPTTSPWYSIQNIQITKKFNNKFEIYGGIKNLLNWTPWKGMDSPIITRTDDPFDKTLDPSNPNDLPFDAAYVYGPNQGIRGFFGFRYKFDKKQK